MNVLQVAEEACWSELAAVLDLDALTVEVLDPLRRRVAPEIQRALPSLRQAGISVLVRNARRTTTEVAAARDDLAERVEALRPRTRHVLERAQRHAREGQVLGAHAWDPVHEAAHVDALHAAGLLEEVQAASEPRTGRYRLHPDLTEPAPLAYDFDEAVMPPTDDLSAPRPGPVDLLHDLAALAAALAHHRPRRTHAGSLDRATTKKLGRRLGDSQVAASGQLSTRWARALGALEALGAVEMAPTTRALHLEPGIDELLRGDTAEAVHRLVRRLVEPDLAALVPALRAALRQAGADAIDELIVVELLHEQHREVVFAPWIVQGLVVYPALRGRRMPWTEEAFGAVEGRLLGDLLSVAERLGLVRRAEGVFAATPDGQVWARTGGGEPSRPRIWVNPDLEILVPPHAVTPSERFQLERLGRCLGRDVVDRYRLERVGLEQWLASHELDEAVELLRRRAATVPPVVIDTLRSWERSATRFVLTRGAPYGAPARNARDSQTAATSATTSARAKVPSTTP